MTRRKNEEEQIEKIIRGLLKQPENKRCINCNSLGPQYVCSTFLTFVCTNCSGVHREFTHRVKSVSMAKFSLEEVTALQAGGNERARQIYLKARDPQRHSFPDVGNLHRIREFIKHVYVDRKYTGDKSTDVLPRLKLRDKEEVNDKKASVDRYGSHSRERCNSSPGDLKYYYDERQSPKYAKINSRYGGFKRSPIRFEIVDNRLRDDGPGSGRKSDGYKSPAGEFKMESMSPEFSKSPNKSKVPVVRPVDKGLGNPVTTLQVRNVPRGNGSRTSFPTLRVDDDVPRGNEGRVADSSTNNQNEASSKDDGVAVKPAEEQKDINTTLIDFTADFEPPNDATAPQEEQASTTADHSLHTASSLSSVNTIESLLFQLTVPSSAPADNTKVGPENSNALLVGAADNMTALAAYKERPNGMIGDVGLLTNANVVSPSSQLINNPSMDPNGDAYKATEVQVPPSNGNTSGFPFMDANCKFYAESVDSSMKAANIEQAPSMQPNKHPTSAAVTGPNSDLSNLAFVFSNQQESQIVLSVQSPGPVSAQETILESATKSPAKASSDGRKELPADLFTASYQATSETSIPDWPGGQPHIMGFGMHYPRAVHMPAVPNPTRSSNPFDLSDEGVEGQAMPVPFPSMASMQGALPNFQAHAGFMMPHSPYSSAMHQQPPASIHPGSHMGQQLPAAPNARLQGLSSSGSGRAYFGSLNMMHQLSDRYAALGAPPNFSPTTGSSSKGYNPFG